MLVLAGTDGVNPSEFVTLLIAGMAIVAAVAALIFAGRRPPS